MKKIFLIWVMLTSLSVVIASPAVLADSNGQVFQGCDNIQTASQPAICKDRNTTTNPANHIIKVATDIVALMTGIAAVIMIIIGGLTMATSSGNSEAVASARKRIIYAIVGLVVVALAWAIITFLTDKLIKT